MYNPAVMKQRFPCPGCGAENAIDQRFCGACGEKLQRNGKTIRKRRTWLKPTTLSWSTPTVNGVRTKTAGCLTLAIILLVLLVGAEAGLTTYGYGQLQTSFEIQECSPEIDVAAKPGVSAVNRIRGLNVEGVAVFTNPSFVPLYIPAMRHEVAIEGKKSGNVIHTRAMAVAPNSSVSQSISLQISRHDLPKLALHPLTNGGTIHIRIVSKLALGDYSLTDAADMQIAVNRPLSSY